MPCDMEDDVLEDVIKHVTTRLSKFDTEEWEKQGLTVRLTGRAPDAFVISCGRAQMLMPMLLLA